jgi:hypothetical protein
MKTLSALLLTTTLLAVPAYAHEEKPSTTMPGMEMPASQPHEAEASANTLKVAILAPQPLEVGKEMTVRLSLVRASDGKAVTFDDLKEAHTKKFHALIIDPTLTDYHHVHPVAAESGEGFQFSFTPKMPGDYRLWADVIPTASGKQEYVIADMKGKTASTGKIDKTISDTTTVDGLTFKLAFDQPLTSGQAVMGKIMVSKDGKPFTQLEPVMGAYAHIVGFSEDRKTVVHIHPMGAEPKQASDRGGPELSFHIEPGKSGFTKLFAQVRVGGKDIFAPLGVMVK